MKTLKQILVEDQHDRKAKSTNMSANDARRLAFVHNYLTKHELVLADDHYAAAMILHHSGGANDMLFASELFRKAGKLGKESGLYLSAAAYDRYLIMTGSLVQKYGTQYRRNSHTNHMELYSVDPATTDQERVALNVPRLDDIPTVWPE